MSNEKELKRCYCNSHGHSVSLHPMAGCIVVGCCQQKISPTPSAGLSEVEVMDES